MLRFSKEMYPKLALLKAAYHFTPSAYLHLDADDTHYLVEIISKSDASHDYTREFQNELLSQTVRIALSKETKNIRQIIMARAFATTIIDKDVQIEEDEDFDLNEILEDWYQKYENAESK